MSKLVHLAIKVDDAEKSAEFYQKIFGFRRTSTSTKRGHTSIHLTDGSFDVALIQYESEDTVEADWAGPGPCIHHFGVAVESVADKEAELRALGCEILSQPGVMPIKFRMPGGIVAEIAPTTHFPGAKQ